ncbi:Cleavage and polyadenylation specificity factor subunit [Gigaspora margarita]|uniref:Cleavage and polyadenylation specificity factor subunit 2 n=1 Tax=Gigaspora margarita TaxID=4874 RepID=A0A8H3XPC6_GIGMA|nr:Cleavage and polyadenylation specificity factor subunit [Gigaspora margarita]
MVLGGKCKGITITAYAAGHTIGGTIWKIKKDTEEIVYAVDYNHKKERHLDGTVLHINGVVLDALSRPSLMITDAYNSLIIHPARKYRDAALFDTITNTMKNKGSVLLPTDSSARVLELAYLYDDYGEIIQVDQFARGIGDENAGDGDVNGDKADMNSDKDEFDKEDSTNVFPESNVPTKYVKLTDALVSSLKLSKLEDYDIAFVNGKISFPPDSSLPVLDVVPIEELSSGTHNPVFVGEVKLTELKRVLQSEGITAEFKDEDLFLCDSIHLDSEWAIDLGRTLTNIPAGANSGN